MRRRNISITLIVALVLTLLGAVPASVSAADYCADSKSEAANKWGGEANDWSSVPNSGKTGWVLNSVDDEWVKGPFAGTLTFDTRQFLWSSPNKARYVWTDAGTIWCKDKRGAANNRPLSKAIRTPAMAAAKYRTGPGSANMWTRIAGSHSMSWKFASATPKRIYVFHGFVDHAQGRTYKGNWTPEITGAGAHFNP